MKITPFLFGLILFLTTNISLGQIVKTDLIGTWEVTTPSSVRMDLPQKLTIVSDLMLISDKDDKPVIFPLQWDFNTDNQTIELYPPAFLAAREEVIEIKVEVKDTDNQFYFLFPEVAATFEKTSSKAKLKINGPKQKDLMGTWDITWTVDGSNSIDIDQMELKEEHTAIVAGENGAEWYVEPSINKQSFLILMDPIYGMNQNFSIEKINKHNYLLSSAPSQYNLVITRNGQKAKKPKNAVQLTEAYNNMYSTEPSTPDFEDAKLKNRYPQSENDLAQETKMIGTWEITQIGEDDLIASGLRTTITFNDDGTYTYTDGYGDQDDLEWIVSGNQLIIGQYYYDDTLTIKEFQGDVLIIIDTDGAEMRFERQKK